MDAGHEEQEGQHGELCEASMGLERVTKKQIAELFIPPAFPLSWSS